MCSNGHARIKSFRLVAGPRVSVCYAGSTRGWNSVCSTCFKVFILWHWNETAFQSSLKKQCLIASIGWSGSVILHLSVRVGQNKTLLYNKITSCYKIKSCWKGYKRAKMVPNMAQVCVLQNAWRHHIQSIQDLHWNNVTFEENLANGRFCLVATTPSQCVTI